MDKLTNLIMVLLLIVGWILISSIFDYNLYFILSPLVILYGLITYFADWPEENLAKLLPNQRDKFVFPQNLIDRYLDRYFTS